MTVANKIVLIVGFKETKKFKKTAIKDKIHAPKKIDIYIPSFSLSFFV